MEKAQDVLLPVVREQQAQIVVSVQDLKIDVVSVETSEKAGFYLGKVKAAQKDLEALRKGLTEPLEKKKKAIIAEFKKPEAVLLDIEAHLKSGLLGWSRRMREEQERKQRELDEKARKQQDEARAKLRDEAAAKADDWDFAEAEAIEQEAQSLCVAAPVLPEKKTLPFNASVRKVYRWEITDLSLIPRELMIPDEKKLNELARRSEGTQDDVPGVRFYAEEILAARGL